jgi:hypothetical protein
MDWFLTNRKDLARFISCAETSAHHAKRLLAVPSREKLESLLKYLFDESEFLSPFGLRSLSKIHQTKPFTLQIDGKKLEAHYTPAESDTPLFGGNSNWRGPIWFPLNYLIIESLQRYHYFYGDHFQIEYPTGSGNKLTLKQIADDLSQRLTKLFSQPNAQVPRTLGPKLFHEYYNPETGQGLGASHQTGWTALIARLLLKSTQPNRTRPTPVKLPS